MRKSGEMKNQRKKGRFTEWGLRQNKDFVFLYRALVPLRLIVQHGNMFSAP